MIIPDARLILVILVILVIVGQHRDAQRAPQDSWKRTVPRAWFAGWAFSGHIPGDTCVRPVRWEILEFHLAAESHHSADWAGH